MYDGDSIGEMVFMFSVTIMNKMTDMDIDKLQIGTNPLLTASPVVYPVMTTTVDAINKWYEYKDTMYELQQDYDMVKDRVCFLVLIWITIATYMFCRIRSYQ